MDSIPLEHPQTVEMRPNDTASAHMENAHTVEKPPKEPEPPARQRDTWEKMDIILKSIGSLGTAVVVALVGYFGSSFLAERQESETNLRLYTELMSKREEADTSLRKEMFNSIITNFLQPASKEEPEKAVLNLELLAYNFHDSLDLAPLFKDVYKKLDENPEGNQVYVERLKRTTRDVVAKQVAMLEEAGGKVDGDIVFEELKGRPGGLTVMDERFSVKLTNPQGRVIATVEKQVKIEVLSARPEKQELEVRLTVRNSENKDEADSVFTVGFFDFPMLDNIRLPEGYRCAVVLNDFDEEYAAFTFIYFPGSRASLKEKPYYDEILYNLRPGIRR
jgi:hypothetical protein